MKLETRMTSKQINMIHKHFDALTFKPYLHCKQLMVEVSI
jgi:hypothetical protein